MRIASYGIACITAVVGALSAAIDLPAAAAEGFERFITAKNAQLYDGADRLRFVSWNIPNLLVLEDSFEFLGESPWRWPDEFEIADALESVRQLGGRVARTYVITVRREDSDMGEHVHVLAPGKFNEKAFVALDRVLKIANEKQVRIIIPLVDNWRWMGGVEQYAAFRGKEAKDFWTDPQLIDDFKATIDFVVNRRNTLTGRLYRDDKAILGWETGNELDSPAEWTTEIAAHLKRLDSNHLVIDGRSLHDVPAWSLDDPNVDVVTTHHYPKPDVDMVERVRTACRAAHGRKAYFVGEAGFVPTEEAERLFATVIDEDASGALYWSLRFHRREGGFYWHDEPLGENLFKAYHWPGFASGDSYEERSLLAAMVAASNRIRGVASQPATAPAAATLLPIDHPGRISWQGAAGADGYDVERASSADGPWEIVGANVSDAAVQYRPLFCDETVEMGQRYFYRVVARRGELRAPPSNNVGPIAVEHGLLVDEFDALDPRAQLAGPTELAHDRARRTQEDVHRLRIAPGGSATYRLQGPLKSFTAWTYCESSDAPCVVATSCDGQQWDRLTLKTTAAKRQAGDYGYLKPVLVQTEDAGAEATYVRISNPTEGQAPLEIARVEISFGKAPPSSPPAKKTGFVKGFSWGWAGSRGSYASPAAAESMDKLADTGADWVCIAFAPNQKSYDDPEFHWGDANPQLVSDDELRAAIAMARKHGFKVILKPAVNCDDSVWRAWIRFYRPLTPEERSAGLTGVDDPWGETPGRREGMTVDAAKWDRWWDNYRAYLLHYAKIAAEQRAEMLCLGCEMNSTEAHEARWRELIADVRRVYDGPLVYNVNHDRLEKVTWWDALDMIGVSAYFAIPVPPGVTEQEAVKSTTGKDEAVAGLQRVKAKLAALSARYNRPVLFIETGITSVRGCARYPWSHVDEQEASAIDQAEQANYYAAMLATFWNEPWFSGFAWWEWPARLYDPAAARTDRGFCIYGKAAEQVVREWYAKPSPHE